MTSIGENVENIGLPLLGLSGVPFPELGSSLDDMADYWELCLSIQRALAAQQISDALEKRRGQ